MCIQTRIQKILAEKEALDAKIVRLEKLESATAPVKILLTELLADYAKEAPEDLAAIWEEVLAIGGQHNLSVQPLAADELKAWEADRVELDGFRQQLKVCSEYEQITGEDASALSAIECQRQLKLWYKGELTWDYSERANNEIKSLRSQLAQISTPESHKPESSPPYKGLHLAIEALDKMGGAKALSVGDQVEATNGELSVQLIKANESSFVFSSENAIEKSEPKPKSEGVTDSITLIKEDEVPGQLSFDFPEPTSTLTELQKLLVNKSNFTFEGLGVSVNFQSVIAPADDTVDFESKEVLITVGGRDQFREYYVDANTFVYQYESSLHQAAEAYAQHFLRELETDAAIKEKIAQYKADGVQQSIKSVESESPKKETDTEFEVMGYNVNVHPQPPLGATFRFLDAEGKVVFATSLTTPELGGVDYKTRAADLICKRENKEALRLEKLANPYAKEEDKFVELIKLTPAVGYLKRKDSGELLAAYAAFANRNSAGQKVATFAKVRAKKWAEYLHSTYESCGWKVEEPRKIARMEAEPGASQQFSYEIKITGASIGQLQKLAEEDFSLLPNEMKSVPIKVPVPTVARTYSVIVNSYELARGTEEEMRSRFEGELKIFGGSQMSVSLLSGSQIVESFKVNDFEFEEIKDFDFDNPEYEVFHRLSQLKFRVWSRAAISPLAATWINDVKINNGQWYPKREAAAVDAVRRLLKSKAE